MDRREKAAIVGAYSREGFGSYFIAGGFLVDGLGFRTVREAQRDTGINLAVADGKEIRLAYDFDLRCNMRRRQGARAQQATWNYLTRELERDAKQHEEYLQTPRGFFRLWLCPDTLGDDRPAREELQRLWEESHSVYPSLN